MKGWEGDQQSKSGKGAAHTWTGIRGPRAPQSTELPLTWEVTQCEYDHLVMEHPLCPSGRGGNQLGQATAPHCFVYKGKCMQKLVTRQYISLWSWAMGSLESREEALHPL